MCLCVREYGLYVCAFDRVYCLCVHGEWEELGSG